MAQAQAAYAQQMLRYSQTTLEQQIPESPSPMASEFLGLGPGISEQTLNSMPGTAWSPHNGKAFDGEPMEDLTKLKQFKDDSDKEDPAQDQQPTSPDSNQEQS